MKAPDKIYIPNNPIVISAAFSSRTAGNDVEYIRKDALLEWAKETYFDENASAVSKVRYKQLIDKINSL